MQNLFLQSLKARQADFYEVSVTAANVKDQVKCKTLRSCQLSLPLHNFNAFNAGHGLSLLSSTYCSYVIKRNIALQLIHLVLTPISANVCQAEASLEQND